MRTGLITDEAIFRVERNEVGAAVGIRALNRSGDTMDFLLLASGVSEHELDSVLEAAHRCFKKGRR